MEIFKEYLVDEFARRNTQARTPLERWKKTTSDAAWKKFADVRKSFPSADLVGDCVVFNIGGNKYRLIAVIRYPQQQVVINEVMTHAEYDKDNWKKDC